MVKTPYSQCMGLIPGQVTEIPHTTQCGKKEKKKKEIVIPSYFGYDTLKKMTRCLPSLIITVATTMTANIILGYAPASVLRAFTLFSSSKQACIILTII